MSFEELQRSVERDTAAPAGLSAPLQALWHDARGDWDAAHKCVQDDSSGDGAWVHAYLHRKEGDTANAGYWYSRAGKTMPSSSTTLGAEWSNLARTLLEA